MKVIIDKNIAYCAAEIKDGICTYLFSIDKKTPYLAKCVFNLEYARQIKGYLEQCNSRPSVLSMDEEKHQSTVLLKLKFVEFNLENLEEWIVKQEITLSEDAKEVE